MEKELRILVLEDNPHDAELIRHELSNGGLFLYQRESIQKKASKAQLKVLRLT